MLKLCKFVVLFYLCWTNIVVAETVRLVVPFAPGGYGDKVARMLDKTLSSRLPYSFKVEYQPGAAGLIASNNIAKITGRETVLLIHGTTIIIGTFNSAATYNLDNDLQPVANLGSVPLVLVTHRDSGIRNIQQLKQTKLPLFYATSGTGGANHLAGELLNNKLNGNFTHVPYKGESPAFTDILSNNVTMMFASLALAQGHVDNPQLIMLGITGIRRHDALPNVPTLTELGISGFERSPSWSVVLANPGADSHILSRIKSAIDQSFVQDHVLWTSLLEPESKPTVGVADFLRDEKEKIKPFKAALFK